MGPAPDTQTRVGNPTSSKSPCSILCLPRDLRRKPSSQAGMRRQRNTNERFNRKRKETREPRVQRLGRNLERAFMDRGTDIRAYAVGSAQNTPARKCTHQRNGGVRFSNIGKAKSSDHSCLSRLEDRTSRSPFTGLLLPPCVDLAQRDFRC